MKSKKAQIIDSGMLWIIATPIIFAILALFLLLSLATYAKKGGIDVTNDGTFAEKLILNKKMVGFLSQKAGETQTVKDLVSQAGNGEGEKAREELFKAESEKFVEEVFGTGCKKYSRSWIRIYKTADKTGQDRYINYDVLKCAIGGNGGIYCKPDSTKGIFITFLVGSDKTIALCGDMG